MISQIATSVSRRVPRLHALNPSGSWRGSRSRHPWRTCHRHSTVAFFRQAGFAGAPLFGGGRTSRSRLFGRPLPPAPERRNAGAPSRERGQAAGGHQAILDSLARADCSLWVAVGVRCELARVVLLPELLERLEPFLSRLDCRCSSCVQPSRPPLGLTLLLARFPTQQRTNSPGEQMRFQTLEQRAATTPSPTPHRARRLGRGRRCVLRWTEGRWADGVVSAPLPAPSAQWG